MLHFDLKHGTGKRYFFSAMVGYVVAVVLTLAMMNLYEAAQPALLYIVPALCATVFGRALLHGQVAELWAFSEEPEIPEVEAGEQGKDQGEKGKGGGVPGDDDEDTPDELRTFDAGTSAPGFQVVGQLKKRT